jgi:hypothetical protein
MNVRLRAKQAFKERENLDWWPSHVQAVLTAVGQAMAGKRLSPDILRHLSEGSDSILPKHLVRLVHLSGKEVDRRKGHYELHIEGPAYAGRWLFTSGQLEKLGRSAAAAGKAD